MGRPPASMLFCPPQPPVPLTPERSVVMGRSRSCDLRVQDGDASRRHAEVALRDGVVRLRDLGSTNGTYVNGERCAERELAPGDRIRIGDSTITFCAVSAAPVPATDGEAKTQLREEPEAGESFEGDLGRIPPFAVLQVLELGRQSGCLHVDAADGEGRLWIDEGRPVHAETAKQTGFDAALTLVHIDRGRFRFEPDGPLPAPTITASMTQLLLEASL